MKRLFKAAGGIGIALIGLFNGAIHAETPLETRPAALSPDIKIGDRIGRFRFLGMLELPDITRNGARLSQLSGLAWDDDDKVLCAISDKGGLFHLAPEFKNGELSNIRILKGALLRERNGDKPLRRLVRDFEGLDIVNGRDGIKGNAELIISTEGTPRVLRFNTGGYMVGEYNVPAPLKDRKNYGNTNKMLESVCISPAHGIITAPEIPLNDEQAGYTRLFSLSGNSWLYPFAKDDRITDIECLDRNEVLVLQQNFLHAFGQITVTLKQVSLTPAQTGPLKPETLFSLGSKDAFQLDNFEGLAHHQGRRFFMVSDNNDLFIQRTLLMYFEILDR